MSFHVPFMVSPYLISSKSVQRFSRENVIVFIFKILVWIWSRYRYCHFIRLVTYFKISGLRCDSMAIFRLNQILSLTNIVNAIVCLFFFQVKIEQWIIVIFLHIFFSDISYFLSSGINYYVTLQKLPRATPRRYASFNIKFSIIFYTCSKVQQNKYFGLIRFF